MSDRRSGGPSRRREDHAGRAGGIHVCGTVLLRPGARPPRRTLRGHRHRSERSRPGAASIAELIIPRWRRRSEAAPLHPRLDRHLSPLRPTGCNCTWLSAERGVGRPEVHGWRAEAEPPCGRSRSPVGSRPRQTKPFEMAAQTIRTSRTATLRRPERGRPGPQNRRCRDREMIGLCPIAMPRSGQRACGRSRRGPAFRTMDWVGSPEGEEKDG